MNSKTKKIKIVTYDNFPYGGAPANFVRYFALSLSLIPENDVEVILPTGNYGNKNNLNSRKSGKIDNVTFSHLGFRNHPKNFFGKFADILLGVILPVLYFFRLRILNKVDKIIVYNTRFSITLWYLIIKFLTGIELIVILPEYYERPFKKISLQYIQWIDFYIGIEFFVKKADKFIVLSSFMREFMISKNVSENNIFLLPNVMDCDFFAKKTSNEFKENFVTIGYCGTPTRKDGIDYLLKSFQLLKTKYNNIHLLIIGDSPNGASLIPELEKKAIALNIQNNITFTGQIPFQKIPELLNSCQILALTRPKGLFAEAGFPTKLGEYFACKKPVLVTNNGDVKKYFVNKVHAVIVEPENLDSIVQGFSYLLENKNLWDKIAQNAFEWCNQNLSYKYISDKINCFI